MIQSAHSYCLLIVIVSVIADVVPIQGGRGPIGDPGDKGLRGPKGCIGLNGTQGDIGMKGIKGEIGEWLVTIS